MSVGMLRFVTATRRSLNCLELQAQQPRSLAYLTGPLVERLRCRRNSGAARLIGWCRKYLPYDSGFLVTRESGNGKS